MKSEPSTLKIFTCTAKHYHPDDGHHDPKHDVVTLEIVHSTAAGAKRVAGRGFGGAWVITVGRPRQIKEGMLITRDR